MSLQKTTVDGIIKIGSSKFLQQVAGLVITAILARLLTPKDFGLIGIVSIFTAFISVFSYLGLGSAIVQRKNITDVQLSTLFWIGLIFGFLSASVLALASYPISLFYKEPQLVKFIIVLGLNFCISPFFQIHRKLLEKELKFHSVAIIEIISVTGAGLIGVSAALLKFGVWSLVIHIISLNLIYLFLFPLTRRWLPKFVFDYRACKDIIHFGLNMVGAYFSGYLARNVDFFIIAKIFGSTMLGFYALACRIMYFPVRRISNIFVEVLYPIFSKIQDDLKAIKKGYIGCIRYISLVTFPLMTLVVILADEFVSVVLGPQWETTAGILKILAPAGAIHSIWQVSWAAFAAIGRPAMRMRLGILHFIMLTIGVLIGSQWGIIGVAYGITSSAVLIWIISQLMLNKLFHLSFSVILKNLSFSFFGSAVLVLAKTFIDLFDISALAAEHYLLLLQALVFVFIYSLLLLSFNRKDIKYLLGIIIQKNKYRR